MKRYFRYEVTEVFKGGKGLAEVGQVLVDTWRGQLHTYQTLSLDPEADELPITSVYRVKLLGEVTDPKLLAKIGAAA